MRTDLADRQTPDDKLRGAVTGADGRSYFRRTTRMSRRDADEFIAAGSPVILDLYGHGRFEWCDGEDAASEWASERTYVVTSEPTAKQLSKHALWTAGIWECDSGERVVYLTGRC